MFEQSWGKLCARHLSANNTLQDYSTLIGMISTYHTILKALSKISVHLISWDWCECSGYCVLLCQGLVSWSICHFWSVWLCDWEWEVIQSISVSLMKASNGFAQFIWRLESSGTEQPARYNKYLFSLQYYVTFWCNVCWQISGLPVKQVVSLKLNIAHQCTPQVLSFRIFKNILKLKL